MSYQEIIDRIYFIFNESLYGQLQSLGEDGLIEEIDFRSFRLDNLSELELRVLLEKICEQTK